MGKPMLEALKEIAGEKGRLEDASDGAIDSTLAASFEVQAQGVGFALTKIIEAVNGMRFEVEGFVDDAPCDKVKDEYGNLLDVLIPTEEELDAILTKETNQ